MAKDSGLRIRIQKELRERFLETCGDQDRSAAQVLREYMHEDIETHEQSTDEKGTTEHEHERS